MSSPLDRQTERAGSHAPPRRVRRASVTLELMLLLPLLLTIVLAVVQFGFHLSASQRVDEASSRAVRVAAQGGDLERIAAAAKQVLGDRLFDHARIDTRYPSPEQGGLPDLVEIRVTVPARAAVPDLLGFIGLGLGDKKLEGRTVMVRE